MSLRTTGADMHSNMACASLGTCPRFTLRTIQVQIAPVLEEFHYKCPLSFRASHSPPDVRADPQSRVDTCMFMRTTGAYMHYSMACVQIVSRALAVHAKDICSLISSGCAPALSKLQAANLVHGVVLRPSYLVHSMDLLGRRAKSTCPWMLG